MKSPVAGLLALLGLGALISCGGSPGPAGDPEVLRGGELAESDEGAAASSNGADCGSLEPLLAMLPTAASVGGLAETFRGCDVPGAAVVVRYGEPGSAENGYTFTVRVLGVDSPYAVTTLGTAGVADSIARRTVASSGALFQADMLVCQGNARAQLNTEGRNPVIVPVNGVEICVRDEMDPNRNIWYAQGIRGELGLQVVLRGGRAEALATTEAARAHLGPLFGGFGGG